MPDIAVYPGTFDPITNGHLDIIERASRHIATVIVAVSPNPSKQPLFTLEERVTMAKEAVARMPKGEVDAFAGLLVDFCTRRGSGLAGLARRAVSECAYEVQ